MIDLAGPFLLVLIFHTERGSGVAVHEMRDQESCRAAIVQLEPVQRLQAMCVAATVKKIGSG